MRASRARTRRASSTATTGGAALLVAVVLLGAWTPTPAFAQQAEPTRDREPVFEINPRGYVQLDWRGYPDWTVATGTGRLNREPFEVRRLRFGVDGRWHRVTYEVTVDPQDDDGVFVKDAYGQLRLPGSFRVRVGQFKVPGSREYATSARSLDFMERSALAEWLAPGRDVGAMLTGDLADDVAYEVGGFAGDGTGRASRGGPTAAGRVAWDVTGDLEVAGMMSLGRTRAVDIEPPNGLDGRSTAGYRFFEGVYVQGRRVRVGVDAEWDSGPWQVTGEVMRGRDERAEQGLDLEDLPAVAGLGWSASVRRELGRRRGTRSRLREWDVSLRFDALSFDDVDGPTLRDSVRPRATDVRERRSESLTLGVSWGPTPWSRLLGNAGFERFPESRSAPETGRAGNYWTLGMRLQLELP